MSDKCQHRPNGILVSFSSFHGGVEDWRYQRDCDRSWVTDCLMPHDCKGCQPTTRELLILTQNCLQSTFPKLLLRLDTYNIWWLTWLHFWENKGKWKSRKIIHHKLSFLHSFANLVCFAFFNYILLSAWSENRYRSVLAQQPIPPKFNLPLGKYNTPMNYMILSNCTQFLFLSVGLFQNIENRVNWVPALWSSI